MRKTISILIMFVAIVALSCNRSGSKSGKKKLTIAVIPKGTSHEFWKSIHAGAIKASKELSLTGNEVEVIWKGPLREDDREQQIQVVEGFASQGVNGIVLAPLDNRALARPVEEAKTAGVPTVIIDSALESQSIVSFVATDNRKGGMLGADRLGDLMGGKGKAILLRYAEGSASTEEREAGFLQEMKQKFPNIELISTEEYAGATRETAKQHAENLLNRFGDDVQGIPIEKRIDTGVTMITLDNLNAAETQALLHPPLDQYLK